MRYIFDNDLHIHSQLSDCSRDPEQTTERILAYAKENNLKTICLTDHFWDESVPGASPWYQIQNFSHISQAKPLPKADGIRFLFGCETDLDKSCTLGISRECFDNFDFVVIPTTHLHMRGFTIGENEEEPEVRAKYWVSRFEAVLNMPLPFHKVGIAHLSCTCLAKPPRENFLKVLELIPEEDMVRLFTKAAKLGCGIELNGGDMNFSDEEADIVLRPFRIAKQCGCKFYFGCDAHHPNSLDKAKDLFERAIDLLELTEEDKFRL